MHFGRQELTWGCVGRRRYRGELCICWIGRGRGDEGSPGISQELKGKRWWLCMMGRSSVKGRRVDLGACLTGVGMKYWTRNVSPFLLRISFLFSFFSRVFFHFLKDFFPFPKSSYLSSIFLTFPLVFYPFDVLSFLPSSFLSFLEFCSFISARFFSFLRVVVSLHTISFVSSSFCPSVS